MAHLSIDNYSFTSRETGEIIAYDRLVVRGSVNGRQLTLKLKLNEDQINIAALLIDSQENLTVHATGSAGTRVDVTKVPESTLADDDKFNLDDEG